MAFEGPCGAALAHQRVEAGKPRRAARQGLHIDRFAGAGGLGDHVDGVLRDDNGVGQRQKGEIGIVPGAVPDEVGRAFDGGESQAFSFPPETATGLGAKLTMLVRETGGSLLITPSRRTRADSPATLAKAIEGTPHFVWDGTGDNPYFALLSLADAVVVTEDSVNMVTEAAGTGKPVYVQSLPGRSTRLSRFHTLMRERGATRPFEGHLESWSYAPVNDTEVVASHIRRALGLETKA
ncbi:MAG: hypothetical protein E4H18_02665 [Hyphomicrobiales bacterium]|nr:MAG: hypothetical protein E4H18_02665 [Hyphomicrobiales bacterium]